MSTNINDGGPAFPLPLGSANMAEPSESGGMTLRDYFAAKAMAAYLPECGKASMSRVAQAAYEMADAMLEQRAKGGAA